MKLKEIIEKVEEILDYRLDEIGLSLDIYKEFNALDEDDEDYEYDTIVDYCLDILEK